MFEIRESVIRESVLRESVPDVATLTKWTKKAHFVPFLIKKI